MVWDSPVRTDSGKTGDRSTKGKLEPGRGLECQTRGFVLSAVGRVVGKCPLAN